MLGAGSVIEKVTFPGIVPLVGDATVPAANPDGEVPVVVVKVFAFDFANNVLLPVTVNE